MHPLVTTHSPTYPSIHPSSHSQISFNFTRSTYGSKDDIEKQCCREEEEEDGEAQCPKEHGVDVEEGRVDPIHEAVPLPATEQSP